MQICANHWGKMRQAIDDRGLSHLVSKTGEQAHAALVDQLEGGADQRFFDPLMNANFAIFSAFLEGAGLAGLDLQGCPLCEVAKSDLPNLDDDWISGAADVQLHAARLFGVAPVMH